MAETNLPDTIECPLCLGKGALGRTEVLGKLGMRDLSRVAQLSAEQALALVISKEKDAEQSRWAKFETELVKRVKEISDKYEAQIQAINQEKSRLAVQLDEVQKNQSTVVANEKKSERLQTEKELRAEMAALQQQLHQLEAANRVATQQKTVDIEKMKGELEAQIRAERQRADDLSRRVEDYLSQVSRLQVHNKELSTELEKVRRSGRREEMDFPNEVRTWPGIWISDKLKQHGDYILAFADGGGEPLEPRMVVDNKDKPSSVTENDIEKLIRDCKEWKHPIGVLVAKEENNLRRIDRELRWGTKDGIWLLRTTRQWLPRDLEVLKPVVEHMRTAGPDFLQRNSSIADAVRKTFVDIDEIEKELKKASKAIENAKDLIGGYRDQLESLCRSALPPKIPPRSSLGQQARAADAGD